MCETYTDNCIYPNLNNCSNYELGYKTGQKSAELIISGHTYEQYLSIKNLYEEATLSTDKWMEGYAQGFDDWCLKNKH